MVSSELLQSYPFFEGLSGDQFVALIALAREVTADPGHYFFHEGETVTKLLLVIDGHIDITINIPDRSKEQAVSEQLMGNFIGKEVTVSTIGPGQILAWSALIPPHESTANAVATTRCTVVAFDCAELTELFQRDCQLGYLLLRKTALVIRERLRNMRFQSLGIVPT